MKPYCADLTLLLSRMERSVVFVLLLPFLDDTQSWRGQTECSLVFSHMFYRLSPPRLLRRRKDVKSSLPILE
jgi:hypothetical protein